MLLFLPPFGVPGRLVRTCGAPVVLGEIDKVDVFVYIYKMYYATYDFEEHQKIACAHLAP